MPGELTALVAIGLVALATVVIGSYGVRMARTTSDFLVASRTAGSRANAAAISGEYLSAASFLGVAGSVLKDGPDALWYIVGATAGYLALLLFVAAPLRRSGAYTLPDFAEARLGSVGLRRLVTVFVVIIGWLYLVPQLQGGGLVVNILTALPSWVGAVAVAVVVVASVLFGGMRSITFVQAFQYWLKLTAVALPAFVLLLHLTGGPLPTARPAPPQFPADTTVAVKTDVMLQVAQPVNVRAHGTLDGQEVDGPQLLAPGLHDVSAGAELGFPAGAPVPVVAGAPVRNSDWVLAASSRGHYSLLAIYSLIIGAFLGTMGLPHVLTRFYTNPDGRAARRTTVVVLGLLGAFYVFPMVLGALSRLYVPQLLVTGKNTDAAVLLLPSAVLGGWAGTLLGGLVAAGAFAAFLSTSSGLVASLAGVLSTDALPGRIRDFRLATVIAGAVPLLVAVASTRLDALQTVVLAFTVSASTFCPLLVLGIWWRGLTDRGAASGVLVGGVLSVAAGVATILGAAPEGWFGTLLGQPAAVTVPVSFLVMIVASKATAKRVPPEVSQTLLRLHAPERLGLGKDRGVARFGA